MSLLKKKNVFVRWFLLYFPPGVSVRILKVSRRRRNNLWRPMFIRAVSATRRVGYKKQIHAKENDPGGGGG